jgi:hypothetical protein
MGTTHHAYNTLKIPSAWGVLTLKANIKDAMISEERMYLSAAIPEDVAGGFTSSGHATGESMAEKRMAGGSFPSESSKQSRGLAP